jgi:hypothetical protein
MSFEEVLGFFMVIAFVGVIGCIVAFSRLSRSLKLVIYAALALRVVGSWLRYAILFDFYDGSGDARGYYGRGLAYAERFWELDFSPFYDPGLWFRGEWWGTSFLSFPSGIILSLIGPSLVGEFLAFSMLAFVGLVGFAVAFRHAYPGIPLSRYARWIWLFPSLWFWPSSVGKESIILMGLGLAVAGFIGRRERINWVLLIVGTLLVFAIRPQVAAVVIMSFIVAYWSSPGTQWTVARLVQALVVLGVGLGGIGLSLGQVGVGEFDADGIVAFMEHESGRAAAGGSAIQGVGVGFAGVPMALVNILTRPFIWEAHNQMALLSALEILAVWVIVWFKRDAVLNALRHWRSHRLIRVAVPFILVYSITLGMLIVNLGIIARQRIFLFPFLFLLLEAVPPTRKRVRARRAFQAGPYGARAGFASRGVA